jgi:hypothetical protein
MLAGQKLVGEVYCCNPRCRQPIPNAGRSFVALYGQTPGSLHRGGMICQKCFGKLRGMSVSGPIIGTSSASSQSESSKSDEDTIGVELTAGL